MKQTINNKIFISVLVLFFCNGGIIYGQIEVFNDNTVKVTDNVTIKRNDTDKPILATNFIYNAPTALDAYMIKNYSVGISKYRYGISNSLYGNSEYEVGIRNDLLGNKLSGSPYMTKDGIYNNVNQNEIAHSEIIQSDTHVTVNVKAKTKNDS